MPLPGSLCIFVLLGLVVYPSMASGNFMTFYTRALDCDDALDRGDDGDRRLEFDLGASAIGAVNIYRAHIEDNDDYYRICSCFYKDNVDVARDTCTYYDGMFLAGNIV